MLSYFCLYGSSTTDGPGKEMKKKVPASEEAVASATVDAPVDKTKKKEPRFYFMDSLSNYGALPQTYEDPAHKDAWTGLLGDGDPIDVCDISSLPRPTGSLYQVKVLGALGMIDGGETDWKVFV